MSDLITIKTYGNRIEAEIDKGLLENNNIKAVISSDDCGGLYPQLSSKGVKLIIQEKDTEKANDILGIINN
ncbi:DUF2007 domain-containing protein [Candidatus Parcubacteria bacterium]|nr:DUF2007 domain-containing protein [Candidatus Parcubacteria bacterium]